MPFASQLTAPSDSRVSGKIAMLGAGKMGRILLSAFVSSGLLSRDQIRATVAHAERASDLSQRLGVRCSTGNLAAAGDADLTILDVKPTQVVDLVREIAPALNPSKLLVPLLHPYPQASLKPRLAKVSP